MQRNRWGFATFLSAYWYLQYCVFLISALQVSWPAKLHKHILLLIGQCTIEYTQQPRSTTQNCCNPYQDGYITIVIDCIVRYQTDDFEIQWFRENTTGAVEDLGLGDPNQSQQNMQWYSRNNLFNKQYNPSYLGKYWCQVINTTADPDQPLMRSNVFTLLAPENYTQPTCVNQSTTIQTMNNITCADLPVHSEQTTLPAPTTTLSSYVSLEKSETVTTTGEYCLTYSINSTIAVELSQLPDSISTLVSQSLGHFDSTLSLPYLTMTAVVPTTSSSSVIPREAPMIILVSVVAVCAVVLLLIVCSSLIVILIVIHQRRRKKKKGQSYTTSEDTG